MIWYDSHYPPNSQNTIVESNPPQGVSFPYAGVTDLSWYQRGVGELAFFDVEAENGNLGERYNLVDNNIVPSFSNFSVAYGSLSSDSNYNISCDFDEDGDVDGNDLARFAAVI